MGTPAFYNDGAVPYGDRKEIIMRGATTVGNFVLENITVNRKSRKISQYDEIGGPRKRAYIADFDEGNAVLEIDTNGVLPQRGDTFTDTFDTSVGPEKFVISEVGQPESQFEAKKANITFDKTYN